MSLTANEMIEKYINILFYNDTISLKLQIIYFVIVHTELRFIIFIFMVQHTQS